MTAILIERRRCRHSRPGRISTNLRPVGESAFLDIDISIGNLPVLDRPFLGRQVRALGSTSRVGSRIDFLCFGRGARVGNYSRDSAFISFGGVALAGLGGPVVACVFVSFLGTG